MFCSLEDLFLSAGEYIEEPYEVLRTVGFRFHCQNAGGNYAVMHFRLEAVRRAGAAVCEPRLWYVNPVMGAFMPSKGSFPESVRSADPDELLRLAIAHMAARGYKPGDDGDACKATV